MPFTRSQACVPTLEDKGHTLSCSLLHSEFPVQCQIETKRPQGRWKSEKKLWREDGRQWCSVYEPAVSTLLLSCGAENPRHLGVQPQAAPKPANIWPEGLYLRHQSIWENLGRWRCRSPRQEAICIPAFERPQRSARGLGIFTLNWSLPVSKPHTCA